MKCPQVTAEQPVEYAYFTSNQRFNALWVDWYKWDLAIKIFDQSALLSQKLNNLWTLGSPGALLPHHHRLLTPQDGADASQSSLEERERHLLNTCMHSIVELNVTACSRCGALNRLHGTLHWNISYKQKVFYYEELNRKTYVSKEGSVLCELTMRRSLLYLFLRMMFLTLVRVAREFLFTVIFS